jgi:hypothetical protein
MGKKTKIGLGLFAALALVIGVVIGTGNGATAARLVSGQTLQDNSVPYKKLTKGTRSLIMEQCTADTKAAGFDCNKIKRVEFSDDKKKVTFIEADGTRTTVDMAGGPKGEPGEDGKDGVVKVYAESTDEKMVTTVGGTFGQFPSPRATKLGEITLPAGSYALTSEGFFTNTDATSGKTRMQLAVRIPTASGWGEDFGTCFTGAISPLNNRESHCSATRPMTLGQETTLEVYAFGYADDQGSADSGKVKAKAYLTAVPAQSIN